MVCTQWAAALGSGTRVDTGHRRNANPLTGEPDAGDPPVRFGGRGKVQTLVPTPIQDYENHLAAGAEPRAVWNRARIAGCRSPEFHHAASEGGPRHCRRRDFRSGGGVGSGRAGASVTVIDMWSVLGGHAVMPGGLVCLVGTPFQREHHWTLQGAQPEGTLVPRSP